MSLCGGDLGENIRAVHLQDMSVFFLTILGGELLTTIDRYNFVPKVGNFGPHIFAFCNSIRTQKFEK
jgi:hypothetical protein